MSDSEGVIDKRKNKCGLFYLAGAGYDERSETVGSLAGSGSKLVLVTMTSLNIASAGAIMKSDASRSYEKEYLRMPESDRNHCFSNVTVLQALIPKFVYHYVHFSTALALQHPKEATLSSATPTNNIKQGRLIPTPSCHLSRSQWVPSSHL